jgi:predicted dehydrogenase
MVRGTGGSKVKKIVIAGAGQLGSRHLQALKNIGYDAEIMVIDPSLESLAVAETRFGEIPPGEKSVSVSFHRDYDLLPEEVDLAILASGAKARRAIVEELTSRSAVKYMVLEKIIFTNTRDIEAVGEIIEKRNIRAWVNCPMRMMPVYKRLKELFGNTKIAYNLVGGDYGLATTLIHQLDFLMFLTECDDFAIDTSLLDEKLIPAKRAGYSELTGTIAARFSNGSVGTLTCYESADLNSLATVANESRRVVLDNLRGDIWSFHHDEKTWSVESYGIPYQSALTTVLADELFGSGTCELPSYEVSAKAHRTMIEALLRFIRKATGAEHDEIPFT